MNPAKITTTVGLNIGEINLEGVTLSFWDLGGQQELQSLWDKVDLKKDPSIFILKLFIILSFTVL